MEEDWTIDDVLEANIALDLWDDIERAAVKDAQAKARSAANK